MSVKSEKSWQVQNFWREIQFSHRQRLEQYRGLLLIMFRLFCNTIMALFSSYKIKQISKQKRWYPNKQSVVVCCNVFTNIGFLAGAIMLLRFERGKIGSDCDPLANTGNWAWGRLYIPQIFYVTVACILILSTSSHGSNS